MSDVKLGQLLSGKNHRDAVHVAIAPVIAGCKLKPGQHIGFTNKQNNVVGKTKDTIGIVDPLLDFSIEKGEQFYMILYPNSVTGMRHHWEHPSFQENPKSFSETWMRNWAVQNIHTDYSKDNGHELTEDEAYEYAIRCGYECHVGPNESARDNINSEWWTHWESITGVPGNRDTYFSCGC